MHWTKDRCLTVLFWGVFLFPSFLFSLVFSSLHRFLMDSLRVQSMQADMPVGSSGSTCSTLHTLLSYCSLRSQKTHGNTHNTNKMATMHSKSLSAYLNIALNNRFRDGEGRKWGRDEEQGANGWLKEWRHHYLSSCSGPSNQSAFEFHVSKPPLLSETQ